MDFLPVSIADAKPIPWRPPIGDPAAYANSLFQSQTRSQSPGDVMIMGCRASTFASFNRRREANPLATVQRFIRHGQVDVFQSQTRSQSPGDSDSRLYAIVDEEFQSQTRSQSPGDGN